MSSPPFTTVSFSDMFGAYELNYGNRILQAKISGAMGEVVASYFCRDIINILRSIPNEKWGYFADLSGCEAYTHESVDIVYQAHLEGIKGGCVIDAYLLSSSVVRHQLDQVRIKLGANIALDEVIFDSSSDAKSFIYQYLDEHTKSS